MFQPLKSFHIPAMNATQKPSRPGLNKENIYYIKEIYSLALRNRYILFCFSLVFILFCLFKIHIHPEYPKHDGWTMHRFVIFTALSAFLCNLKYATSRPTLGTCNFSNYIFSTIKILRGILRLTVLFLHYLCMSLILRDIF